MFLRSAAFTSWVVANIHFRHDGLPLRVRQPDLAGPCAGRRRTLDSASGSARRGVPKPFNLANGRLR
jgi:hypothetical protein